MRRRTITEAQIREIAKQELLYRAILEEGIWDDVKSGARKLMGSVTKQITGSGLVDKAKEAMGSVGQFPKEVNVIMQAVKKAMAETGEEIKLDDTLKAAKEIGQLTSDKMGSLLSSDLKGPVHNKAASLQNEWKSGIEPVLNELSVGFNEINYKKQNLQEGGVLGILGLSLAGFGGIMFALSGLEKLANYIGAESVGKVLHKVHHVLHSAEEKAIGFLVPNTISFIVYNTLRKRGFKAQSKLKRALTREEYDQDVGGAKTKTEKLIYAAFLIFLAWNGVKAALHAGVSMLGFAEGTATVIKGAEIGQAAAHIGDIIELGIEEAGEMSDDATTGSGAAVRGAEMAVDKKAKKTG